MSVQIWTYLFIFLSFGLYIVIALWSKAGSTHDFYVAGGGVKPMINGMATAADWMSAASFISMAGLISFLGRDGTYYLMGWTGGYVLLALLLAPYLRKFGKFTVPAFIGDRYYSQSARLAAVFCAIVVSFVYVCGQMQGAGIVFSRFLEVDITTGVIIGMAIVFFYAVLGGMKGITYTQVAQYCVLIFAYMVPAVFISLMMTGNPIPQLGFGSELTPEYGGGYLLDRLDGVSEELGFGTYTAGQKSTQDVFFITAALMFGTAGLPHVIIRFFTVPTVRAARLSAGYALIFIAILYTTAPAIAAFSKTNLMNTVNNAEYTSMPDWFTTWERTGLIAFNDKNNDGRIQYVGDAATNELTVNRDIMVLANPEIAQLPNWVVALVAAGALAAALSTAAGLLLVISTSISHDLLKRSLAPHITEKQELKLRPSGDLLCRADRGVLWHQSAGIRRRSRGLCVRPRCRVVLPGHCAGDILQPHEQAGCRRRDALRLHLHSRVHHLLQVHQSRAEHCRKLVVRHFPGRHRHNGHTGESGSGPGGMPVHGRTPGRGSGDRPQYPSAGRARLSQRLSLMRVQ
jgi:cation/acetate symporter